MNDTVTPGTTARCCWEVVAGIIPTEPMPEYTRRWVITTEHWDYLNKLSTEEFKQAYPDEESEFWTFAREAHEYARSITDPRGLNWVRVDWIWF